MASKNLNPQPEIQPPPPPRKKVKDEAMVVAPRSQLEYLNPVFDLDTAKRRLAEFQQFAQFYLKDGEDYGVIPGTQKPTLLKPGADKLAELYGLAPTFPDERMHVTEDWHSDPPLFDYRVTCVLIRKATNQVVGEGLGLLLFLESKYRWRDAQRKCPNCGKETILRSKYDDCGWFCFSKKGGCGAKFSVNDERIASQPTGRSVNADIPDIKNTILKMAKKRAQIDAVISVTRSSGIFTQDTEDMPEVNGNGMERDKEKPAQVPVNDNRMSQAERTANVKEAITELDQQMTMEPPAPSAPTFSSPTFGEYRKKLQKAQGMDYLMDVFKRAYRGFASDPDAQGELRRIYEERKKQLQGTNGGNGRSDKRVSQAGAKVKKNAPVDWN